jgi:glucose/arabinose dehydrogenase
VLLRSFAAARSLALIVAAAAAPVTAPAEVKLPDGFVLVDPFPSATFDLPLQVVFLPDGRSLVAEQAGRVLTILEDGTQYPQPFIDIRNETLSVIDLGLLSIAVDPDFTTSPWVYLLLTVDPDADGNDDETDAFARVVRYLADENDPNVADLASRQVLLGATWPEGIPALSISHTIGTLRCGADGSLLVSAGDGAHPEDGVDDGGRDPQAFGPGRTDPSEDIGSFRSRSLASLAGKILRLDKETGLGLEDNPYWDGDGGSKRSKVYAYGLRNPYRFTVRPGTGGSARGSGPGTLYICDVGWDDYEEIDVAPAGGINFGWPCDEGPVAQPSYAAVDWVATGNPNVLCDAAPSAEVPDANTAPLVHWHHDDDELSNPTGWTGSAGTCAAFYTGSLYPPEHVGRFFFGDYSGGWIRTLELDAQDQVVAWHEFATGFGSPIVDLAAHPVHGDLYAVEIFADRIWRIENADAVDVEAVTSLDRPFRLADPAPNPASGAIRIAFSLPAPAGVTVDVFDPAGHLVRSMTFADAQAGENAVTWDGRNARGHSVEPSMYIVRLKTPWGADARKLVVHERPQ